MPRFAPFPGLRYNPDRVPLPDVVAPPYDVIGPEEQTFLQQRSPYNSVRIELPDAAPGLDPYQAAGQRLADWLGEGVLQRDEVPSLYGYLMASVDPGGRPRQTVGVIGALGVEPPGTAGIFPHERTTPKAKSDRLQLLQTTRLNTSPIWGLSLAKGLSDELMAPQGEEGVIDADGVRHLLWPITDLATIERIVDAVSAAPVVIADGHHRFETALTYRRERRRETADRPGDYDAVMALVVELVDDQLSVQGIHRLISGLPEGFDLVGALAQSFDLAPTEADPGILDRMAGATAAALGLVTPAGAWLLRPTAATEAAATHDLDSSRLEVALAALPPHQVVYQHGLDLAVDAVGRGDAQAAVLLRPVTVDQIAATAQGGARMPPKTTFFWPKPRTGFVFREVAG